MKKEETRGLALENEAYRRDNINCGDERFSILLILLATRYRSRHICIFNDVNLFSVVKRDLNYTVFGLVLIRKTSQTGWSRFNLKKVTGKRVSLLR